MPTPTASPCPVREGRPEVPGKGLLHPAGHVPDLTVVGNHQMVAGGRQHQGRLAADLLPLAVVDGVGGAVPQQPQDGGEHQGLRIREAPYRPTDQVQEVAVVASHRD
ncbi:hypothetical protein OL239_11790 [Arthrobacter sp. ATA002]|uniref:hypothetical protein n=1 Tax=Arthrobacter sp. ATA002 TaxID=2991715 RepID=UPI0022A78429|nr:hypothetical protein [Arthrobacter sp. ATA002]WAP50705.1 hypothetical protein OL239_11790 [Arthrobacter sp. ATA002]